MNENIPEEEFSLSPEAIDTAKQFVAMMKEGKYPKDIIDLLDIPTSAKEKFKEDSEMMSISTQNELDIAISVYEHDIITTEYERELAKSSGKTEREVSKHRRHNAYDRDTYLSVKLSLKRFNLYRINFSHYGRFDKSGSKWHFVDVITYEYAADVNMYGEPIYGKKHVLVSAYSANDSENAPFQQKWNRAYGLLMECDLALGDLRYTDSHFVSYEHDPESSLIENGYRRHHKLSFDTSIHLKEKWGELRVSSKHECKTTLLVNRDMQDEEEVSWSTKYCDIMYALTSSYKHISDGDISSLPVFTKAQRKKKMFAHDGMMFRIDSISEDLLRGTCISGRYSQRVQDDETYTNLPDGEIKVHVDDLQFKHLAFIDDDTAYCLDEAVYFRGKVLIANTISTCKQFAQDIVNYSMDDVTHPYINSRSSSMEHGVHDVLMSWLAHEFEKKLPLLIHSSDITTVRGLNETDWFECDGSKGITLRIISTVDGVDNDFRMCGINALFRGFIEDRAAAAKAIFEFAKHLPKNITSISVIKKPND